MGQALAARCGLDLWARCSEKNSERDAHRVIERQALTLTVSISEIEINGHAGSIPWIAPKDWFSWLVNSGMWPRLAGANDPLGARANWTAFWQKFRLIAPNHDFFTMDLDFARTAAFFIHGDEGTTLKHSAVMVTSLQSCLGLGFNEKEYFPHMPANNGRLKVNYSGCSLTHRFVTSVLPKTCYEQAPHVFDGMMEKVASSLSDLLLNGVRDAASGETFFLAILGVKGDQPYLVKVGKFYRSFNTQAKRGDERNAPKGICPRCLAGIDGYPAEELATSRPRWWATKGTKLPWLTTPPLIRVLPHDPSDPSTFFWQDIWHVVHLGFGRSWIASTLHVLLATVPGRNMDERWSFFTLDYRSFCRQYRLQPHVGSITPYLMSYGDHTGTMGQWHKAALTATLMRWLQDLLGRVRGNDEVLSRCYSATKMMNELLSCLFRSDVFLDQNGIMFVTSRMLGFLRDYAFMSRYQFNRQRPWNYPLYPKLHVFHEMALELKEQGATVGIALNPLVAACQQDEDIIGKVARVSRRVNIRRVTQRTLQRYLVQAKEAFEKANLLR